MVHLHTHSTFSFMDGYGTAKQYADRMEAIGHKTLAITDHGNIFAHRYFAKEFAKRGLKFIPGCELYVKNRNGKYFHMTALCENNEGYENLCKLVTISNQSDHFDARPQVSLSEIKRHSKGLILLSGCFGDGAPFRALKKSRESAIGVVRALKRYFGDKVYLEVQHHDPAALSFFRGIGELVGIKCVPTCDAHYPNKEDYPAEDLMLCIGTRQKMGDLKRWSLLDNLWLMSDEEASKHFTPEEMALTHEIADRCNVTLPKVAPMQLENARELLIGMVGANCVRLGNSIKTPKHRERYTYELSIIDKLGLHSYFVIMADVINAFKTKGCVIGPARGSSAGSLICYLMGITEIDPIKYELSFERFLDINRKDYPDIDTDFPPEIRGEIVQYLREKYGEDRIGRICSFTKWAGASCFWDIVRVHGLDREVAKRLSKAVPKLVNDQIGMEEILSIPEVRGVVAKFPELAMAVKLEGQIRQLGQHASGFAVSPVAITKITAEARAGEDSKIISLDKDMTEDAGLIKLDLLGLSTLDMIQAICRQTGIKSDELYRLDPTDPKVLDQFNQGNVAGVFQFEGAAVRRVLKDFTMSSLEDLSFVNAVARPGAINALDEKLVIPDCVRPFIYKNKYFVYQEELMAILRFLNFDWADVTKIRKMVSKKQVMLLNSTYHALFVERLSAHCSRSDAECFWLTINKCGEYMFNKSHAVSYGMLAYICMWLKVYHREAFVKHYMNIVDDDEKRREMIRECYRAGWKLKVYAPSAEMGFTVADETIIGGLTSIKGIGEATAIKMMAGKIGKAGQKAIDGAEADPVRFAPWAALDDFKNRYRIGHLPEGDFVLVGRVWNVKDGACVVEDINGAEKGYFDTKYLNLESGKVYKLYVTKYKYLKIDNAQEIKDE